MERECGGWNVQPLGNLACWNTFASCRHKKPEYAKARFLSQGGQRNNSLFSFHIFILLELSKWSRLTHTMCSTARVIGVRSTWRPRQLTAQASAKRSDVKVGAVNSTVALVQNQ